jgi:hypothetical protein
MDSKIPFGNIQRSAAEIEEIVIMVRLDLYNRDVPCGAQAIRRQLEQLHDTIVRPLPSLSTINRILRRNSLTHRRTGNYRYDPPVDLLGAADKVYQELEIEKP